jgi:hypothetical protein
MMWQCMVVVAVMVAALLHMCTAAVVCSGCE